MEKENLICCANQGTFVPSVVQSITATAEVHARRLEHAYRNAFRVVSTNNSNSWMEEWRQYDSNNSGAGRNREIFHRQLQTAVNWFAYTTLTLSFQCNLDARLPDKPAHAGTQRKNGQNDLSSPSFQTAEMSEMFFRKHFSYFRHFRSFQTLLPFIGGEGGQREEDPVSSNNIAIIKILKSNQNVMFTSRAD